MYSEVRHYDYEDSRDWYSSSGGRGTTNHRYAAYPTSAYTSSRNPRTITMPRENGWDSDRSRGASSSGRRTDDELAVMDRPPSRLVYDGRRQRADKPTGGGLRDGLIVPAETDFLVKVQSELENQRESWKAEVDRLSRSTVQLELDDDAQQRQMTGPNRRNFSVIPAQTSPRNEFVSGTNSYVDTSGHVPLFKAFVDVSEFHASDVRVTVDKLSDKIVVEAKQSAPGMGSGSAVAKTFTQRVQLPRFADDGRLVARMNQQGILKLEVPLLYYFASKDYDMDRDGRAKSFVYEIRDDPTDPSRQLMEILVNTGSDVSADDLRVEVDGDRLLITGERATSSGGGTRRNLIKRYTLPPKADVPEITSRLGRDGRLTVMIPIKRQ